MPADPHEGVAYSYVNIGAFASPGWLGRVVGFSGRLLMGCAYTYTNVLTDIYTPGVHIITEDGDPITTETGDPIITEELP